MSNDLIEGIEQLDFPLSLLKVCIKSGLKDILGESATESTLYYVRLEECNNAKEIFDRFFLIFGDGTRTILEFIFKKVQSTSVEASFKGAEETLRKMGELKPEIPKGYRKIKTWREQAYNKVMKKSLTLKVACPRYKVKTLSNLQKTKEDILKRQHQHCLHVEMERKQMLSYREQRLRQLPQRT